MAGTRPTGKAALSPPPPVKNSGFDRWMNLLFSKVSSSENTVVLLGGTQNSVVVSDPSVNSMSSLYMSVSKAGGTQGLLSYAINSGVGYTITSTSTTDTSTITYTLNK